MDWMKRSTKAWGLEERGAEQHFRAGCLDDRIERRRKLRVAVVLDIADPRSRRFGLIEPGGGLFARTSSFPLTTGPSCVRYMFKSAL